MTVTKEMVREGCLNGAIDGDGHSIVSPDFFIERGFDRKDMESISSVLESGDDYKSQIFQNGEAVKPLEGIGCLHFHYWVASQVGVTNFQEYGGRGSQARAIAQALKEWANQ